MFLRPAAARCGFETHPTPPSTPVLVGLAVAALLAAEGCSPSVVNENRPAPATTPLAPAAARRPVPGEARIADATRRVAAPGAIVPSPTLATIVVTQPKTQVQPVSLLDQDGTLLGQVMARSHTVLLVPAGPLHLYAVHGSVPGAGDVVQGSVDAGKVYWTNIGWRFGGLDLVVLSPRSGGPWEGRASLVQNPRLELDPALAPQAIADLGDTTAVRQQIDQRGLGADERASHTLHPEDGE